MQITCKTELWLIPTNTRRENYSYLFNLRLNIFTLLKVCLATAIHNFKWVKISRICWIWDYKHLQILMFARLSQCDIMPQKFRNWIVKAKSYTLAKCWADVGASSSTLAQHQPSIGPKLRVCWIRHTENYPLRSTTSSGWKLLVFVCFETTDICLSSCFHVFQI